ncbi:MFS transporter [Micromonospora harpali]|uniref:MFS transporter n=1 Tax=Micromonospora harpali TaxID=1490225 RepID=A0ABW1I093_9ACTN
MTTHAVPTATTPRRRARTVATTVAGNFIEYFDWLIFGLYAPLIAQHFFPSADPLTALLAVFVAYATGMLFRPLGGILMGALADRRGRRLALLLSITLMGGGSLVIGLLPTYAAIGVAAPVLLFLARAAQGLSAGGEWPAAVSYLMELAPRSRRCLFGSIFAVSSAAGGLAASALGLALSATVGSQAMADWGWRVPFLAGAALSAVLLVLRRQLGESEAFVRARRSGPPPGLRRLWRDHRGAVVVAALFVVGVTVQTTTWTTVAPALAQSQAGMPADAVYAAVTAAIALSIVVLIPLGLLADRVGVLPMLVVSVLGFAVAGPLALNAASGGTGRLVLCLCTGLFFMSCLTAVLPKIMASMFPTHLRASGIGLPHAVASSLAGGLTPALATWLAGAGRLDWYLGLLTVTALLAGAAGVRAVRRARPDDDLPQTPATPASQDRVLVGSART